MNEIRELRAEHQHPNNPESVGTASLGDKAVLKSWLHRISRVWFSTELRWFAVGGVVFSIEHNKINPESF